MKRLITAGMIALTVVGPTGAWSQEARYKLGVMDRVRVHVHEWPALTGEFTIGANGDVTLPMIGQVPASGLQTDQLAAAIGARLRAKVELSQAPDTSVDIVQYRPFYITGAVERPGEYAFRPGMLVLNAVTIAGGVYRPPRSGGADWGPQRDAVSAKGDLRMASARRVELDARKMRLDAEVADADTFPEIPANATDEMKQQLLREKATFAARYSRIVNQERANAETIALLNGEIDAVNAQIAALERHKDSVQKELDETRVNVSKGILPAPRLLPIERTVHQIESEQKALATAIMRARQQINTTKALTTTLRDERRAAAAADLVALKQQFQEAEERYRTAVNMLASSSEVIDGSGPSTETQEVAVVIGFSLVRNRDGKVSEVSVDETTRVEPGDVIKVTRTLSRQTVRRPGDTSAVVDTGLGAKTFSN